MRGTQWGQGYNQPTGCSAKKAPHTTFKIKLKKKWVYWKHDGWMPARNLYSGVEHLVMRLRTSDAVLLFPLSALMAWTRTNLPFVIQKTMASCSTYWLGMKGGSTTFCLKWRGKAKNGAHCSSPKISQKIPHAGICRRDVATVWKRTTLILWPPRYHHKSSDPNIMDCSVSVSSFAV